ncbi:dienelactone hydrolase family protein [Corynebacterium sp. CCUG 18816]|uniref:alpha/beta hydrolase family esterase n=1 Tax=Corynebacterium pseudogenitalium TaxID=38303 RepID=UPI00210EE63E|nr:dienelactone hydrolase family protein [Corynebacterium pseudogenitalium]
MKNYRRALCAAVTATTLTLGAVAVAPEQSAVTPTAQAQQMPDLRQLQKMLNPQNIRLDRLALLVGLVAAIVILGPVTGTIGSSHEPGRRGSQERRTVNADGLSRSYNVVLPSGYEEGKSYPVIIGYGGWQHTADQMQGYAHLESAAAGRAIVVYAEGESQAWAGAPYARTSTREDIAYTRAIIDDLVEHYGANRDRVSAVGLSNGGGMVASLACHAPELVNGIASVAGAYYNPTVEGCKSGSVPTLIMHGTNDNVVGYDGGTRHGAAFRSVNDVFNLFMDKNGCIAGSATETRLGNVTTLSPACGARTELQRVEGGGHTWFTDPSASTATVDFLLSLR